MSAKTPLPVWRLDEVSAESMFAWVEALNDANPIHVDPQAAQALGYGARTVNPGPANLAYVLNMLMAAVPEHYPTRISARFLGNVLAGDAVEASGEVQSSDALDYHARLRVTGTDEAVLEVEVQMEPLSK
jgi:acyl dehydratase